MGFGGSTRGAIVSLKNNKRTRKSKTDKLFNKVEGEIGGITSHRSSSPEELEQLRLKLKTEHKKNQQQVYLISAVLGAILLIILLYFMFYHSI